ncbi:Hypothetical predicted protein [Lecanosticta acicola]|uniref:Mid2 domain-containing protein n=1 Tax=Lecanosticta acicola TaxID=111012 RepID=A0AAI8Z0R7_9PEZI|nr:Hypothetical predicted protein [Lecanosticta acicola]
MRPRSALALLLSLGTAANKIPSGVTDGPPPLQATKTPVAAVNTGPASTCTGNECVLVSTVFPTITKIIDTEPSSAARGMVISSCGQTVGVKGACPVGCVRSGQAGLVGVGSFFCVASTIATVVESTTGGAAVASSRSTSTLTSESSITDTVTGARSTYTTSTEVQLITRPSITDGHTPVVTLTTVPSPSTTDLAPSSIGSPEAPGHTSNKNIGKPALIALGVILAVILIAAASFFLWKRHLHQKKQATLPATNPNGGAGPFIPLKDLSHSSISPPASSTPSLPRVIGDSSQPYPDAIQNHRTQQYLAALGFTTHAEDSNGMIPFANSSDGRTHTPVQPTGIRTGKPGRGAWLRASGTQGIPEEVEARAWQRGAG